jgi:uncharacterized protein DUF6790
MYVVVVALTMFALPILSVAIELGAHPAPVMLLVGKWFVFWAVGVRLVMAGLRQLLQPDFTAREIFHMKGDEALTLVRELGVSNFAVGVVGLAAVAVPTFVLPSAITAGVFYGVAGARHVVETGRSRNEAVAMVSDLFAFAVLATFAVARVARVA